MADCQESTRVVKNLTNNLARLYVVGVTTIVSDISHITRTLLVLQRKPKLALARHLEITSSGLSKKLSGDREWSAKESGLYLADGTFGPTQADNAAIETRP